MTDRVSFEVDGITTKVISLETDKGKTYTQVLELREDHGKGKPSFYPTHFQVHDTYEAARIVYLGLINQASYENGNSNAIKPNGIDNIFVRGSKPFNSKHVTLPYHPHGNKKT